jgi:membrane associated rhomboid family serine protease
MRRFVPGEASSASASYSYSSPYYQRQSRSSLGFGLSKQGRNLAIFIVAGLAIGLVATVISVQGTSLINYLIQDNSLVLNGWVVPLVTSIFVAPPFANGYPLGIYDVLFNALAVVFIDRLVSNAFSARQYYIVFLATAIFGNLLTLVYGPNFFSFGASGGIFGLIAAAVSFDYAKSRRINSSLVMWFAIVFVLSSVGGNVNWVAHLGGALSGLFAGYYIGRKI